MGEVELAKVGEVQLRQIVSRLIYTVKGIISRKSVANMQEKTVAVGLNRQLELEQNTKLP